MTTSKYYDDDREFKWKEAEKFIRKVGDIVLYKGKKWFVSNATMITNRDGVYFLNDCICCYTILRINKKNNQVEKMHLYNDEIETLPLVASNDTKYVKFEKE